MNVVVDALSHKFTTDTPIFVSISFLVPKILTTLQHYYAKHIDGKEWVKKCATKETMKEFFRFNNGFLYFKDKLFIPNYVDLRTTFLTKFHYTPLAGHSNLKPTLDCLATSFHWPRLSHDTKNFTKATRSTKEQVPPNKETGVITISINMEGVEYGFYYSLAELI